MEPDAILIPWPPRWGTNQKALSIQASADRLVPHAFSLCFCAPNLKVNLCFGAKYTGPSRYRETANHPPGDGVGLVLPLVSAVMIRCPGQVDESAGRSLHTTFIQREYFMSRSTVLEIFEDVFNDFNEELPADRRLAFGEDVPLFGSQSALESIEVVTILVNLESSLSDHFGQPIRLTDEKAMSQGSSPFRNVGTLVSYATTLVEESPDG